LRRSFSGKTEHFQGLSLSLRPRPRNRGYLQQVDAKLTHVTQHYRSLQVRIYTVQGVSVLGPLQPSCLSLPRRTFIGAPRIGGERCFELVPIRCIHLLALSTKSHDGEHLCNLPEVNDAFRVPCRLVTRSAFGGTTISPQGFVGEKAVFGKLQILVVCMCRGTK
jgi:hypothetical protein